MVNAFVVSLKRSKRTMGGKHMEMDVESEKMKFWFDFNYLILADGSKEIGLNLV